MHVREDLAPADTSKHEFAGDKMRNSTTCLRLLAHAAHAHVGLALGHPCLRAMAGVEAQGSARYGAANVAGK